MSKGRELTHELVKNNEGDILKFKIKDKEGTKMDMAVMANPFGNCQTCTVGFAQTLIRFTPKELAEILAGVIQKFGKFQFLIDIKTTYVKELKDKLEPFIDCILVESPYANNTGTEMTILLVKLKMKF